MSTCFFFPFENCLPVHQHLACGESRSGGVIQRVAFSLAGNQVHILLTVTVKCPAFSSTEDFRLRLLNENDSVDVSVNNVKWLSLFNLKCLVGLENSFVLFVSSTPLC